VLDVDANSPQAHEEGRRRELTARISSPWLAAVLAGGALSRIAGAQTAPETSAVSGGTDQLELADVVVSAQRRRENAQQVPISVVAVSGEQADDAGVSNTLQVAQLAEGVSTRVTYNQLEPYIRGVGTTAAGPGIESPVSLYVDDVYYGSQIATAFSLIDVDQIAVLKGPQGTLFGRNATGGVIQVSTRDPTQEPGGDFRVSYDDFKTTTADAYVTGGLGGAVAGSVAVRYSGAGEGWGRNVGTGDENHKLDSDKDIHAKLKLTPDGATTIRLNGDYSQRRDSLGPNFTPVYPQYTFAPVGGYILTGNPWDDDSQLDNRNRFISDGASLKVDQELAPVTITSISAYRSDHLDTQFNASGTSVPGFNIFIDERTDQYTQEFQVHSHPDARVEWQAGLFGYRGWGIDDPLQVDISPALVGVPLAIVTRTREVTESAAGYLQTTQDVASDTHLTVGVRYTWEQRSFRPSQQSFVYGESAGFAPPAGFPLQETVTKPTWRLALDHRFTGELLGYVSYNRGFKSGGYNTHSAENPPFSPETLDAYEIGGKTEWLDHRLRLNTAGFFYDYKNVQVAKYTTTSLIYNGAAAHIYGVDVDLDAVVAANLRIAAGVEWLHARYTDFPSAPYSTPVIGGGPMLYYASAVGKALNNAPDATAVLRLDYRIPMRRGALHLNVAESYSSGYYQEPDNFLRQGAYSLVNASVAWLPGDRWTLKVYGSNLLNKAVATQLSTSPVPPITYLRDYSQPPRVYGASAEYRF
jgi:iron complex outermembrane recepter protein